MRRHKGRSSAVLICVLVVCFLAALAVEPALAGPACSPTKDTTIGGGWLAPTSKMKRTFALEAGISGDEPEGRLLFINHITGQRLEGMVILYGANESNTRVMTGVGKLNEEPAAFNLSVTDVAEPGRSDLFNLHYFSDEGEGSEVGTVGGGNIQIRPLCAFVASRTAGSAATRAHVAKPRINDSLTSRSPARRLGSRSLPMAPLRG